MTPEDTTIAEHMSAQPHTIGQEQSLERATDAMRRHCVRHLPVLAGGRLVGIVSERDLALVSAMPGVDPASVPVAEAMTPDPYAPPPDARLVEVVRTMADRKLGAAVVVADGTVRGIFTAVDGLALLADRLAAGSRRHG